MFKPGDKVKLLTSLHSGALPEGAEGEVLKVNYALYYPYEVLFPEFPNPHNLGWVLKADEIALL